MKKINLKLYISEIILLIILSFALFVPNIFRRITLAIILIIFTIIICNIIKKKNNVSINFKQVTILMTAFAIIYLVIFYLLGLYFGFYKAEIKFSFKTVKDYIVPISILIITTEIIRNIILAQEEKYSGIIIILIMIVVDLIIYENTYNLTSLNGILSLLGFIIFASISTNLLYNYISNRYGYMPNIVFRLITTIYIYILPDIPNVYMFFRTLLRIIYPFIIYQILEYAYSKRKIAIAYQDQKKAFINRGIVITIAILISMLISCQFRYGILVIGSGSMTGTLNKGDAVIFEKYEDQNIEIGTIIIYQKANIQVVHRVIDKKTVNGEIRLYTKGDANQTVDDGYVTNRQIKGISKLRVKYIGYPTIWVRDILN